LPLTTPDSLADAGSTLPLDELLDTDGGDP
jgi:hypothetical protein